jgi:hypothetical protein
MVNNFAATLNFFFSENRKTLEGKGPNPAGPAAQH